MNYAAKKSMEVTNLEELEAQENDCTSASTDKKLTTRHPAPGLKPFIEGHEYIPVPLIPEKSWTAFGHIYDQPIKPAVVEGTIYESVHYDAFIGRHGDYIWTGHKYDTKRQVELSDVPFICDAIEHYIMSSDAHYRNYMFVKDQGNLGVLSFEYRTVGKGRFRVYNFIQSPSLLQQRSSNKEVWMPEIGPQKYDKKTGEPLPREVIWKKKNPYSVWNKSERFRPQFESIAFKPYKYGGQPSDIDDKTLNMFLGWPLKPIYDDSKCTRILAHLLNVLCAGDEGGYRHVKKLMATKLQFPDRKVGSAVSFRSRQGGGKGIFIAGVLGKIYGEYFRHFDKLETITGRFNTGMSEALFIFLDEAFFTRNREAANQLKTLITEDTVNIERKGKDIVVKEALFDIFTATNFEMAASLEESDRRYTVFDLGEEVMPKEYFDALKAEMDDGGVEAFFGHLLSIDLNSEEYRDIDITKPYETDARLQQKMLNFTPLQEWWYEVLSNGYFPIKDNPVIMWETYQSK
ncbi:primase-helicase family protein, partial [Falsigemmobacter intermedius]